MTYYAADTPAELIRGLQRKFQDISKPELKEVGKFGICNNCFRDLFSGDSFPSTIRGYLET